uniref:Purinergic receptor P2X, ligand-gated ion channel, 3b n=1 Tax=Cyprinodon variegatus TaxID=28743 RepID=A0A3Q2DAF8_CYPVA
MTGRCLMWSCITNFFTYETTKSVVVKSWTIGIINRIVQLIIISYFVGWVFLWEKAYQVRDTAIESSVMTKVKGFGNYNNRVMDVADYVTPTQGGSVFCIITKMITTENQVQGYCPEVRYEATMRKSRESRTLEIELTDSAEWENTGRKKLNDEKGVPMSSSSLSL